MFIRYTHHGIGHPKILQQMARDCANADLMDSSEPQEHEDGDRERDFHSSKGVDERELGDEDDEGGDSEDEDDGVIECDDDSESGDTYPDDWEIEDAEFEEDLYVSF
jgi:hypothetical protein